MLGERIKDLREEKGLTQEQLAEIIKTNRSSLSFYESGTYEPSVSTLIAIADYFNVSTDYLLGRTKNESSKSYDVERKMFLKRIENLLSEYDVMKKD